MYRFSVREMLAVLVIASVTLTFTKFDFLVGAVAVIAAITLSGMFLSATNWRCLAYGSVLGILLGIFAAATYARISTGIMVSRNYQESNTLGKVMGRSRPYLIPIGSFIGATTSLLLFGERRRPDS